MAGRMKEGYRYLMDHQIVTLLSLSLVILCFAGVGNVPIVGMIGIILCTMGCLYGGMAVDLWVLVPLLLFDGISIYSSWETYGTIAKGFSQTQAIFTVVYLLMACLEEEERLSLRRFCISWMGIMAIVGMMQFMHKALIGEAARAGGVLGAPNAFGICLVVSWLALIGTKAEGKQKGFWTGFLRGTEPLLLSALALTLSMGSFVAMAMGILVVFWRRGKDSSWKEAGVFCCRLLARASVGVGLGLLMYIASRRTNYPWLAIPVFLYILAAARHWQEFICFLEDFPRRTAVVSGFGVVVAALSVLSRPSAAATFAERLKMMKNGLGYIGRNPVFGVGPYQWRGLNLQDSDIYFNTWHIHNVFIHIGVELGLVAMAMLVVLVVRHFLKRGEDEMKPASAAFLVHNMMDTDFFFEAVPILALLMVSRPKSGGRKIKAAAARLIFAAFGGIFIYNLVYSLSGLFL